jgi:hypothetical protein
LQTGFILKGEKMTFRKPAFLIFCFLILLTAVFRIQAQSIPKPGADFAQITNNGIWTWYGEPKAVYYEGVHKRTYLGWISNTGTISVGFYDHETGDTLTHIIRTGFQTDDHAHPSIIMRPDGRLLVAFSAHDGSTMNVYIATNPEDISSFGSAITALSGGGFCYPNLMWLSAEGDSGRLYCFIRGVGTLPSYSYSDDWGKTWTPSRVYFQNNDNTPKPYCKYCSNGKDEVHMVIERGHRGASYPAYYMKFTKGAFFNADGQKIGDTASLPIMNTLIDTMHNPASAGCNGSGWDIALDNAGRPVVVYDQFNGANAHTYLYIRWTGTSWFKKALVNSGASMGGEAGFAGGVTLDHENTNIVYMSRQVNGMHEIDKWTTSDGGTTWDSLAITRGSAKKNTRPCVPRGHIAGGNIELIWNYGDYTTYNGGAWNMAVKMYPFRQPVGTRNPVLISATSNTDAIRFHSTGISLTLADPGASSLRLFSLDGRLAADCSPLVRKMTAGGVFIPFSVFHHANGAFVVIFNDGKRKSSTKISFIQKN